MRQNVRDGFIKFNEPFENRVDVFYLDTHQSLIGGHLTPDPLVTIGVGNLVDPLSEAIDLPMINISGGGEASKGEIMTEWSIVKGLTSHWQDKTDFWRRRAKLRLKDADINDLCMKRLLQNESILKGQNAFRDFESWPSGCQMALLSMAWAMGAGFGFPLFRAACRVKDWKRAAAECEMDASHNAGLRPRNAANKALFLAAVAAPRVVATS